MRFHGFCDPWERTPRLLPGWDSDASVIPTTQPGGVRGQNITPARKTNLTDKYGGADVEGIRYSIDEPQLPKLVAVAAGRPRKAQLIHTASGTTVRDPMDRELACRLVRIFGGQT